MNFSKLIESLMKAIRENGPELLTGLGVAGVGATAYLAAKGGHQAAGALSEESPYMSTKEKIHHTWILFVPATLAGVATVTCIIYASKGNAKRTAAAVTAYSITERAFSEYREKMIEQVGKNKDQKALAGVATDAVRLNPPPTNGIIVLGRDDVLMMEMHTGRYFRSSVDIINRATNEINRWINTNRKATLNDFYNEIGLAHTDDSAHHGWTDDELLDIMYIAVKTEDDRPCLAIRYNYCKPLP